MNILAALADNDEALDQVYNVAVGGRTSLNQLYLMIRNGLISADKDIVKKDPIYRDFRAGDVLHSQADINKARAYLGYCPTHRIEQGISESLDWYMSNL